MPKYSIIIPVRAINEYVRESIYHINEMDYESYEVLIITDTEKSADFVDDKKFKIIASGSLGPGEKRNIGVENAKGDIMAFLDDDAYPTKEWLQKADMYFKDNDLYALGGPAVTPLNASDLEKASGSVYSSNLVSGNQNYRYVPKRSREIIDYASVNLFVRKEAFDKVGGFITEFWPGEDTKLCLDLLEEYNRPFLYAEDIIVYHHRRNMLLPHLKQVSRYGRHRGRFAKVFPQNSRLPVYFVPSIFLLGLALGGLLSLFSPIIKGIYLSVLVFYLILVSLETVKAAIYERSLIVGLMVFLGIPLTHLVYGYNFILGYFFEPKLKLKRFDEQTGNYIEG